MQRYRIRIYNNDRTDYVDYTGSVREIREQARERLDRPDWKDGHSEVIDEL